MTVPTIYRDDTDASVVWEVTDAAGQDVDWASPVIAIGDGAYAAATWLGSPAPTRQIRLNVPLALGLAPGAYPAYLKVPSGGIDFRLGWITVADRT
jgi:hypothetical protein